MGVHQLLLALTKNIVSSFTLWDVVADNTPGNLATATFSVNSNGSVSGSGSPNDFTTPGSLSWFVPNTAGIGSSYFVRFTITAGVATSNDAVGFTALSSNRTVTKGNNTGANSCTVTVDIATDAGGTNIVFTSVGNVVRNTHT